MTILTVKKVFRGNGKKGSSVGWYANPNNPGAEGIKAGSFLNSRSHARWHVYDKRTVKQIFKDFELVFEE